MTRKTIRDLIVAHYENRPVEFFNLTLKILKEFKEDGCKELADELYYTIHRHIKVVPKRPDDNYVYTTDDTSMFLDWQTQSIYDDIKTGLEQVVESEKNQ